MFGNHRRDVLKAHEREVAALKLTIDALAEQIEYLRMQLGQPNLTRATSALPADFQLPPMEPGLAAFLSEEEEDLQALHDNGHITDLELEEQLALAGLRSTHLTLAT